MMVTNPIRMIRFLSAFPSTPTNMNADPEIKCQDWIDIYRCLHCGKIVGRATLLLSNLCIMPPIHSPSFFSPHHRTGFPGMQADLECLLSIHEMPLWEREREKGGESVWVVKHNTCWFVKEKKKKKTFRALIHNSDSLKMRWLVISLPALYTSLLVFALFY